MCLLLLLLCSEPFVDEGTPASNIVA